MESTVKAHRVASMSKTGVGSCNFCNRYQPTDGTGKSIDHAVTIVEKAEGSGISVRFCDICLADLRRQTARLVGDWSFYSK